MEKYYYHVFKNTDKIGEAFDGPGGLEFNSFDTYHPVLRYESEIYDTTQSKKFSPGYACKNKGFYNEEIRIGYCTIISAAVDYERIGYSGGSYVAKYSTLELVVSDKAGRCERKLNIKFRDSKQQFIPSFIDYINFINILIDKEIDIKEINTEILSSDIHIQKPFLVEDNLYSIFISLSNINIRKIESSQNRIGKDNRFWTSYILENLSHNDEYIESILRKAIGESMSKHLNDGEYYAYSPSFPDVISDLDESSRLFVTYNAYYLLLTKYYNSNEHKFFKYIN